MDLQLAAELHSKGVPLLPSLDVGGVVLSDGLAMIHRGEEIRPAAVSSPWNGSAGGGDTHIHLSFAANGRMTRADIKEHARTIAHEISKGAKAEDSLQILGGIMKREWTADALAGPENCKLNVMIRLVDVCALIRVSPWILFDAPEVDEVSEKNLAVQQSVDILRRKIFIERAHVVL